MKPRTRPRRTIAASILALLFCFELRVMSTWPEIRSSHGGWIWARLALSSIADSGVFIGAIGMHTMTKRQTKAGTIDVKAVPGRTTSHQRLAAENLA